jgi:formate hydrogenlyase subunit 3/multisubunit Na+/H+ antiporter MnhD subunit
MATRIVTRLLLLLLALAAATALMVGGLAVLASTAPDEAVALPKPNQAAELRKDIGSSAQDANDEAPGAMPTPTVVLVFAGIVLMAALPPVYRVHVYGTYHPQRWP